MKNVTTALIALLLVGCSNGYQFGDVTRAALANPDGALRAVRAVRIGYCVARSCDSSDVAEITQAVIARVGSARAAGKAVKAQDAAIADALRDVHRELIETIDATDRAAAAAAESDAG